MIKVLIVDDSRLIRGLLSAILASDPALVVVGTAADPYEAREKIKQLNPDVITLDVEMPRMDGITFLRNLMRLRPMPVVMISTLTEQGADVTLQALELGAVDYIAKPRVAVESELPRLAAGIVAKVKQAATANVAALEQQAAKVTQHLPRGSVPNQRFAAIGIGASTGGTEAIRQVLAALPPTVPPVVVVQHMPAGFTNSFARRLNSQVTLTVTEFCHSGQPLLPGHAYIAHGGAHLRVERRGRELVGVCDEAEPVNRHRPSVDVLFQSLAEHCGASCIAAILTGMGRDGVMGMSALHRCGALTVAQDEATSVVWGMPRAAVQNGVAEQVLPLTRIGALLVQACHRAA